MIDNVIVIGFKKVWEEDNTISYHVIKLTTSGGKKDFIEFPIDKQPAMFDTVKVDVVNGYNIPTAIPSTTRTKDSVKSKLYNFIAENYPPAEETDPTAALPLPKIEGCYIEGTVLALTTFGKLVVGKDNGERIIVYAHDLLKHTEVAKGDKVRLVGDLQVATNQLYAYVIGCLPYIREVKPTEENKSDETVKKGIDDCEGIPPRPTPPPAKEISGGNSTGGSGNRITITRSGYELSADGLSFFADKLMDEMKVKVIRGSSRLMREIYVWKEGFYRTGGDIDIEIAVKQELQELYEVKWFTIVYNHIISKKAIDRWEFKPPNRTLNIENGILEYPDKKVIFTPRQQALDFHDMNFTYKVPLVYDPNARCPETEATIQQILVDKGIDKEHLKLQDISKAIMRQHWNSWQTRTSWQT